MAIFSEGWITKTIIFSFMVGGLITVISASGGVQGFIEYLTKKRDVVKDKRGALLLAYITGLVILLSHQLHLWLPVLLPDP